jgi:hypothetical protein
MIDDQWRKEYRDRKYLENLSNDELLQRGRAVFRNFMTINARGRASPLPINHRLHGYWRSRFVHFLEECVSVRSVSEWTRRRIRGWPKVSKTEVKEDCCCPRDDQPEPI